MASQSRSALGTAVLVALVATGCGDGAVPAPFVLECGEGLEAFRGRCVDPARRYEPDAPLDADNVVAFGPVPDLLALPPPPHSGFRIVAPARTLAAGEEWTDCVSWPIPDIARDVVYAARLYTTPGLHHSNVIAKPPDPSLGPNPYPACHPGSADAFSQFPVLPDVLFANSTQVVGDETIVFPAGLGYVLDTTREISSSIHLLNSAAEPLPLEVVYDFFTMAPSDLAAEVAPFVMQVDDFSIPAHQTAVVEATCKVFGGTLLTLMPHTHQWARSFVADLIPFQGPAERVADEAGFDLESDIELLSPPRDLSEIDAMHFACDIDNTTDHEMHYGIGENEMCILFGYLYPAEKQFAAHAPFQGEVCQSFQLGNLE